MGKYTETFTGGDLSSGVLTVTHSLGQKISDCIVVDSSSNVICPDVNYTDDDELTVDLSETGITSGTVVVMSDEGCLAADKTVNLDNSMSASEIQALIDAQPKNLNGYTLTFQFADGTYSLSTHLEFYGFYGGQINVYGNSSDNSLSTSKAVYLNSSNSYGLFFKCMACYCNVQYLKVSGYTDVGKSAIYAESCMSVNVYYNYCIGSTIDNGHCIRMERVGAACIYSNYVSNSCYGISVYTSNVFSSINDDTGTQPKYGLRASNAGLIGKNGTQPSGSVGSELITMGGEIRS